MKVLIISSLFIVLGHSLNAQCFIGPVNEVDTAAGSIVSYESHPFCWNGDVYFSANDGLSGSELWTINGTTIEPSQLVDIVSGSTGSIPKNFVEFNNELYFSTWDGSNAALYKTDGTLNGTLKIKDFLSSVLDHGKYTVMGATLYFTANDGMSGSEIWKTDGTIAGTVLVTDIGPGAAHSAPFDFTEYNGELYFKAIDPVKKSSLFKTDGITTTFIVDLYTNSSSNNTFLSMVVYNGELFTTASNSITGAELHKYNASTGSFTLVKNIYAGAFSASPLRLQVFNGEIFFVARDGVNLNALYKTDGTAAGTVLVKDINLLAGSDIPPFYEFENEIYFASSDNSVGFELWKSDGTTAGTVLIKDINPGTGSGINFFKPATLNGQIYFPANDGLNGTELWKTDGTPSGTVIALDVLPGTDSGEVRNLVSCNGELYFTANHETYGPSIYELDVCDDSPEITCEELNKILASDAAIFDFFGVSVAADANRVVVGASNDDDNGSNSGSAYVYEWDGNTWNETKLIASDGSNNFSFGNSVSVSGDRIVVGSPGDNHQGNFTGSMYVFEWNGNSWIETKIIASDAVSSHGFGQVVNIHGDMIITGATLDDDNGSNAGSAYAYEWDGTTWNETKFLASDGSSDDFFGVGLAIHENRIVIGANSDDDNGSNSGSIYVYDRNGASWTETKIIASDGAIDDFFGANIDLDADRIIVSSVLDDDNGTNSGSVYLFDWNGSTWIQTKLIASDGAIDDKFGAGLAVLGDRIAVGAFFDDDNGLDSGSAYIYDLIGGSWIESKLTASDGAADDKFATRVALTESFIVAGGVGNDDNGTNSGSAYIFECNNTSPSCIEIPVAICEDITVDIGSNGSALIVPTQIGSQSTDDCEIVNISLSETQFNCADLGTFQLTLQVTDNDGNMDDCEATVTLADNIAPILNCQEVNISLDMNGVALWMPELIHIVNSTFDFGQGGYVYDPADNCTDNNDIMIEVSRDNVSYSSDTSFTCADIGNPDVWIKVSDASGNYTICTPNILVEDTTLPVVQCQNIDADLDSTGISSISAFMVDTGSSDACGAVSISIGMNSVDCSHLTSSVPYNFSYSSLFDAQANFISSIGYHNGLIYLAKRPADSIYVYNELGVYQFRFDATGPNSTNFSYPGGITFDSNNNIYVSDRGSISRKIIKFDSAGNYIDEFATPNVEDIEIQNDIIYACLDDDNKVSSYDLNGNFLSDILTHPSPASIDIKNGKIYVVDNSSNAVFGVYDFNGAQLLTIPLGGWANNIGADDCGNIYVWNWNEMKFSIFDDSGNLLASESRSVYDLWVEDNIIYSTNLYGNVEKFDFTCEQFGVVSDTMTVVDQYGNQNLCTYTIAINDPLGYCDCGAPYSQANNNMLTNTQSTSAYFETNGVIQSDQIIDADVDYDSGTFIELLEGFEVKLNHMFHAFIDGCNNLIRGDHQRENK